MDDTVLCKVWPHSQLNTAISCLTYGLSCFYFDRNTDQLLPCIISIHEQYINILHIIIQKKASFLFQLQNVKSISDKDIFIRQTLKNKNFENFIVIYTSTFQNHVLVMPSENQINVLWEGLQYFIYEANNFYSRISLMDPFKAQTAMLFMNADADGSKLLDIQQVLYIFNKLKINKVKQQIQKSIVEINEQLYQKQNLKKPKDFSTDKLTPLGFQYILQYYSLKYTIAPIFTEFCPIFKFKHKQFKKTIIDILKTQTKPLMSGIQFQQFLAKYMKTTKTQEECIDLIKTFPIYDGEGKQIPQQIQYLSFHNFCNYIFSSTNSIMDPNKMQIYQDMTLPITEYFIYSSSNTYLAGDNVASGCHLQMYQFSLKKGCRCVEIDIHIQRDQVIVKHVASKKHLYLADVLKTIKNIAFSFNPFPVILSIQCNFVVQYAQKIAKIFQTQIGQSLYMPRNKDSNDQLPSPMDLKNKFILQLVGNTKKIKEEENALTKIITFMPTKLDFQRKGQTCWDNCQIQYKSLIKHEQIQQKNLTDYCRKTLVRTMPPQLNGQLQNYDTMPMFRNGVQLASFNMKKQDKYHYFIHSKFLQNGGRNCGYLLKPYWMRSSCMQSLYASNFNKLMSTLKVKVYAGQKFILTQTKSTKFFIQVSLKGTVIQQKINNKKYLSQPTTQGFYSDFQMQCQFAIYCMDLAHLVFAVIDEKQQILSYRAIPAHSIREGLRTVSLLGPGMELNTNNCLMVQTTFVEQKTKKRFSALLL